MFPTNKDFYINQAASIKVLPIFQIMEDMKMDVSTLSQLIGSLGFPIACCIYLIYTNNKAAEKHAEEVEKLRETVDNNTKAMLKLCAKMGVEFDG
jgi:hypothetical protein